MPPQHKALTITGWVLSALLALLFLFAASGMLMQSEQVVEGLQKYGYPLSMLVPLGATVVCAVVLLLIPQTSILGGLLLTGYLGGAVATHVRAEENFVPAIVVSVVMWVALLLREPRLRALLPLTRKSTATLQ